MAARAVEQRLNADTSDYTGPSLACDCGQTARYGGRRIKIFRSILGELRLDRASYHCPHCGRGFYPRDRHLGIEKTCFSPAAVRMIGTVGSMVSFQEGSQLLQELAGIGIHASQVQRGAEALGDEIAADERFHTEPLGKESLPSALYLGLDGTGIPMRAEDRAGRAGKQPDGSAKTREVKVCAVWSAEARDSEGLPMRDEGSVSYSAAIESAATPDTAGDRSALAGRVSREASRRRFCEAERRVVVADGAPWIWNIAQDLFPGAIQIVDRLHVKQTLHRTAQAIFGSTGEQAKPWETARCAAANSAPLFGPSALMPPSAPMPHDAGLISFATVTACGIRGSTNKNSAPHRACSKPVAKLPSELASNDPVCIRLWPAPTASSRYDAAVSARALKTSGSAEMILSPPDSHFCAVHPLRKLYQETERGCIGALVRVSMQPPTPTGPVCEQALTNLRPLN